MDNIAMYPYSHDISIFRKFIGLSQYRVKFYCHGHIIISWLHFLNGNNVEELSQPSRGRKSQEHGEV